MNKKRLCVWMGIIVFVVIVVLATACYMIPNIGKKQVTYFNRAQSYNEIGRFYYSNAIYCGYDDWELEENAETLYAFRVNVLCYAPIFTDDILSHNPEYVPSHFPKEENETDEAHIARLKEYHESKVKEMLREEGFYILEDGYTLNSEANPYVFIAGTRENMMRVFEEMNTLNGWIVTAEPVMRPDMEERFGESGYVETTTGNMEDWYWRNEETMKEILGERTYVTMKVTCRDK